MVRATCVMREIYPFFYETIVLEYDQFLFFPIFIIKQEALCLEKLD